MRDRELHPKDPRNHPNHQEHGPRKFTYTWEDLAEALGCTVKSAQNMAGRKLFDPTSLASVIAFREARQQPRKRKPKAPAT